MKKLFLLSVFCLTLLSACSSNEKEKLPQSVLNTESNPNSEVNPSPTPVTQKKEVEILSHTDIDLICDGFSNNVSQCKDGSQIIIVYTDKPDNCNYIHYVPKTLPNGDYEFFQKLNPSYDVSYNKDGSVVIPICINASGDYRFEVKVDYTKLDGKVEIHKKSFIYLNKDDTDFNEMYAALDYDAQDAYCLSLTPDKNITDKELAGFLRACVYDGNLSALDELYKLMPVNELESKYKIELAGSMVNESNISISDTNPYESEIFYGESCKNFPRDNSLTIVAKSLQKRKSLKELGVEEVEPNCDWYSVYKIPNLKNYYEYVSGDQETLGVYKLDLDKDGLMEILIFLPGGSMGNEFWEVLHLDKSGRITDTNSGEGMRSMALYRYKDEYFFLSKIMDFNDKEFLGWEVYALNKKEKMYRADIWFEKIGSEIVFNDKFVETDDHNNLDWELDRYIDIYKRYEEEAIGKEINASEEIQELFDKSENSGGKYGVFDFNNDNVEDWTNANYFYPSNMFLYYCNYKFVDGKTNQLLDFSNLFNEQTYRLCRIIPYRSMDKNYFVCVLNGYGNYIIKLIEIRGIQPIEVQNWLVAVKNRILIDVTENTGSRWGL